MVIPLRRKGKQRTVSKICAYNGCGKEFFGHHIRKYCDFHTEMSNRKRVRRKAEAPGIKNRVLKHNLGEAAEALFECPLPGCCREFAVKLYPRQYVYPKYCELHRNTYQRFYHLHFGKTRLQAA